MGMSVKNKASLHNKIYRKIHHILFQKMKMKKWGNLFYRSWRHAFYLNGKLKSENDCKVDLSDIYLTQIPNEGAGIGHQISNYNSGLHYATFFGLKHAYVNFKNKDWDKFLGFGENEVTLDSLRKKGYKVRRLPYYGCEQEYNMIREIIRSYSGEKVVFLNELDQFYREQYGVCDHLKRKFNSAEARKTDEIIYDKEKINLAIHVRRGDIGSAASSSNSNISMRWLDNNYYENVLDNVINRIKEDEDFRDLCGKQNKDIDIYIFSQGNKEDFKSFDRFGNVHFCLDMEEKKSFLHMVRADILITSRSSFSYKPALISEGIKICPPGFWHDYPDDPKWIKADETGYF